MTSLELQLSGPFSIPKVLPVSLLLKWEVSFTDLHTSQEHPPPTQLDLFSASICHNTAQTS